MAPLDVRGAVKMIVQATTSGVFYAPPHSTAQTEAGCQLFPGQPHLLALSALIAEVLIIAAGCSGTSTCPMMWGSWTISAWQLCRRKRQR
jgi:hypothetical protein